MFSEPRGTLPAGSAGCWQRGAAGVHRFLLEGSLVPGGVRGDFAVCQEACASGPGGSFSPQLQHQTLCVGARADSGSRGCEDLGVPLPGESGPGGGTQGWTELQVLRARHG